MNLLDKYMIEVGKHLPRKNRLDLQAEIRSTLEDMLEDRSRETGRSVDDALTAELLQEYGAPAKVAAAYKPARALIGPHLYPIFTLVVKIVLIVLTVLAFIRLGVNLFSAQNGPQGLSILGKFALETITTLISAFGNIVLVFAILERLLPVAKFEEEIEAWTPSELESITDPDRLSRAELIIETLFIMLALVVLNLYPDVIGFHWVIDDGREVIPALSEAFFRYLPWINLLAVFEIAFNLYLIQRGFWQPGSRIAKLGLSAANVALAVVMLSGPSLINVDAGQMAAIFGEAAAWMGRFFHLVPVITLVVLIIVEGAEALQTVWRLVQPPGTGKIYPE